MHYVSLHPFSRSLYTHAGENERAARVVEYIDDFVEELFGCALDLVENEHRARAVVQLLCHHIVYALFFCRL
jgi:hypothetical protein